jgi:hypothetical protein
MSLSKKEFSNYIKQFKFRELFNEMGWNNDRTIQPISVDNITFSLQAVAEKSGFKILVCPPAERAGNPPDAGLIPDSNLRKKIETKVTRLFHEHLIIYTDAHKQEQIWQLVVRQAGKPTKVTETRWHIAQDPQLLFQRASGIIFEMAEEDTITIVDVTKRMSDNFNQNAEKVTKKFYEGFKKEHTAFLQFIEGIEEKASKEWYVSLMLNRLMFCYFIQKKGFLDRNKNYLRDKLLVCRQKRGENKFYSFYRDFLLLLFHSGLNGVLQSAEVKAEIGLIPYLNGGLFDEHELEKKYQHIAIDDKAFERLFDFFDQYEWHLDTRINASGKDINPDVIGYIFEKYINDRAQMGAYYTKEDITEYIGKNCIIPFLFDETKRRYPKAFAPDGAIWQMVRQSGDRYIYDAVKKGIDSSILVNESGIRNGLPDDVVEGLDVDDSTLVEKRKAWNKPAPPDIALPTEIYREVIDRRKRYYDIKTKIESGEIANINDFITYNLNIRQFTIDVIENTNDPEFLRHFYIALICMTLLDPTCGSGAFLFAALNILEELYEACLLRMRNFVEDEDRLNHSEKSSFHNRHKYFRDTLAETQNEQHPNQQYFIYKTIILRNLYGVDIMKEAVEIAKLRLFLKLVATVEVDYRKPNLGLEPLPDIDFNIRAGNTLVGFATDAELQKGLTYTLDGLMAKPVIEEKCELVAMTFARYKDIQLGQTNDYKDFKEAKESLQKRLVELNHELNILLHFQASGIPYNQWLESHQPFHWFAEFYEIVHDKGGFDIVIGNPPYVELKVAEKNYKIINTEINTGGNLHSLVAARALQLIKNEGSIGFIVPVAIANTDRMEVIRKKIVSKGAVWITNYAIRPGKLFSGAEQRLSIYIFHGDNKNSGKIWSSKYYKWNKEEREFLFENISLTGFYTSGSKIWFKFPSIMARNIQDKIQNSSEYIANYSKGNHPVFYKNTGIGYYIIASLTPPECFINGIKTPSSRETTISFQHEFLKHIFHALISSSIFFLYYHTKSNCRDLNPSDITSFKFPKSILEEKLLIKYSEKLQLSLIENSWFQIRNQKQTGEVRIQSFTASLSKSIIDEIDTVLAEHYGFTSEELDFIINYDIKYRMGKELDEGDEDGE